MPKASHRRNLSTQIEKTKTERLQNEVISDEIIFQRLKDSLKVFEKLKKNFELAKGNNSEIKKILKTIAAKDYIYITDIEKINITKDITDSHESRISIYKSLFEKINKSIEDIRDCYKYRRSQPNRPIKRSRKLSDLDLQEVDGKANLESEADDMCNFCDTLMQEGEKRYISQIPYTMAKKTKINICDGEEFIDIDDTVLEYEDISFKKDINKHTTNGNVSTNFTNFVTQKNVKYFNI